MNLKSQILIIIVIAIIIISVICLSITSMRECFNIGIRGVKRVCNIPSSECYDISYQDTKGEKGINAEILPGYFIDISGYLDEVPFGYKVSSDMRSYEPLDKKNIQGQRTKSETKISENKTSNKEYNSDNLDMIFHSDPLANIKDDDMTGKMWVKNDGNLIAVPYNEVKNRTLYYEPGIYEFNSASYVPNYPESVFLSKLSNEITTKEVNNIPSKKNDICASTESSKINRDAKCNNLKKDLCSSTECCVLLGGEKCVAGDEKGPYVKSNYSDQTIINRDYYYYREKCYGHCL
jgi:hypothetical protein